MRTLAFLVCFLSAFHFSAMAHDQLMLSLVKKSHPEQEVSVFGSKATIPAYDFGEAILRNDESVPMVLKYNIAEDQCFVPIVRDATGKVVSNGRNYGYSRAPSSLVRAKEIIVDAKASRTFGIGMPLETVPIGQQHPGKYFLRIRLDYNGTVWESNEIEIDLK